jgi:hypothetical protein
MTDFHPASAHTQCESTRDLPRAWPDAFRFLRKRARLPYRHDWEGNGLFFMSQFPVGRKWIGSEDRALTSNWPEKCMKRAALTRPRR